MNNNYILRQENTITAFYYADKKILARKYENGKFGEPETALAGALKNFTLKVESTGEPCLYCRDAYGNILLITYGNEGFVKKTLLENKSNEIQNLLFYPLNNMGVSLIYNIPTEQKRYKLLSQGLTASGAWAPPEEIDSLLPYKDSMFYVQPKGDSTIVCYVNGGGSLGFREFPGSEGFTALSAYSDSIVDYNVFAEGDTIHFLYITSGMFTNRLVYRKKTGEGLSKPQIVWEAPQMDNCMLWIYNNILWAGFMSPGGLHVQRLVNGGVSFSQPEIYKNKFCKSPVKAVYLSALPMDSKDFFLREIYVDINNPWDIQMMPDLTQCFLPKVNVEPVIIREEAPKKEESPKDNMILSKMEALSAENQELRYKYAKAVETINENANSFEVAKANMNRDLDILREENNRLLSEIKALRES